MSPVFQNLSQQRRFGIEVTEFREDIDFAFAHLLLEMDDVAEDQVASRRNLNFNSNTNADSIDDTAFNPIYIP